MATKPNIYVANTTSTSVLANAIVPLGSIIRRYCACTLNLSGNAVTLDDKYSNYYLVTVNGTFTAPVAGVVTLQLTQNGTNIVGATASETITTASTETRSISFSAIVRATCGCTIDTLTVLNSGVAATFTNMAVTVERI